LPPPINPAPALIEIVLDAKPLASQRTVLAAASVWIWIACSFVPAKSVNRLESPYNGARVACDYTHLLL
jgi:hypothetical protein